MELPGRFMTTEFLLEDLSLGQTRGIQRKPFPAFAVFQVTTVQNNRYAKVTYFRVVVPELLQLYLTWHALLPFSLHHFAYSWQRLIAFLLLHFTDEETETERDGFMCPRSGSQRRAERGDKSSCVQLEANCSSSSCYRGHCFMIDRSCSKYLWKREIKKRLKTELWPLAGRRVEEKKKEEETLQDDGIEMPFPRLTLLMAVNLFYLLRGVRMCLMLFGHGLNENVGKWKEP